MGTRTYSRRGVLTAAGRRRAGLEAIDIFGNALPGGATPPPATPVVPSAPVTPPAPKATPRPRPQPKTTAAPTPAVQPTRPAPPRLTENAKKSQRRDDGLQRTIQLTPEQYDSLEANTPTVVLANGQIYRIDYNMQPDNPPTGKVTSQGPLQIDPARMSPKEITDKIMLYAQDHSFEETMRAFYKSMRHPNPAKPEISIKGFSKETKKVIESTVDDMFGMFSESRMKDRPVLQYKGNNRMQNANYTSQGMWGSDVIVQHKINMNGSAKPIIVIHETAHAVERYFGGITAVINLFGKNRIQGLPRDYKPSIRGFATTSTNHVDNPYTLASRDGFRFAEVFSTGFESILHAKNIGDRQLIESTIRAIQQANGYYK